MNSNKLLSKSPMLMLNAASNWVYTILNTVITLGLTPFIIQKIGETGYGFWGLTNSLVGYYGILNLGITSAVSRYVAKAIGTKNNDEINTVYNTALTFFSVIAVIVAVVTLLFVDKIIIFFGVSSSMVNHFKIVIIFMGLSSALTFPTSVMISVFIAHEQFVLDNIIKVILRVLKAVFTVISLEMGYGIVGVAAASLIVAILNQLLAFLRLALFCPWVKLKPSSSSKNTLWKMLIYGSSSLILTISNLIRTNFDNILIGKVIGLSAIAAYSIAATIITFITNAVISGTGVLYPRYSRLYGANEIEKLRSLLLSGLYYSSFLTTIAATATYIFGAKFITIWVGDGYSLSVTILYILGACNFISLSQQAGIGVLLAMNKHKKYAFIVVIEALVNLILSVIFAYKFGVVGVAIGTAIPMIFVRLLVQPVFVSRVAGISIIAYLKSFLIPIIPGVALISTAFIFHVHTLIEQMNFLQFSIIGMLTCGTMVLVIYGIARLFVPELIKLKVS